MNYTTSTLDIEVSARKNVKNPSNAEIQKDFDNIVDLIYPIVKTMNEEIENYNKHTNTKKMKKNVSFIQIENGKNNDAESEFERREKAIMI